MTRVNMPVCQTCPHRKGPVLGCCNLEELEFIAASKSTHYYQKGQTIYQEGNVVAGLHCVHQGKIKISKASGDDKEQIVHLARQGDLVGFRSLLAGNRYTSSAVALDDCVVCFVPRPDFLRLVQANLQFSAALMQLLARTLGEAEERILQLAHKPVRERLAGALLLVKRTFREEGEELPFHIALPREDWAALVGTTKETISRLLSEFKQDGMLTTRGSQITILQPARLQELFTRYD